MATVYTNMSRIEKDVVDDAILAVEEVFFKNHVRLNKASMAVLLEQIAVCMDTCQKAS